MLLLNPYFWLGELGLLLTIVSCLVLWYRFRHESRFIIVPIWFLLVMSLDMFVRPAIYTTHHTIPPDPYLYRLAVGILVASRAWVWRRMSDSKELIALDKIAKWGSITLALAFAYIIYRIRQMGR